MLPPQLVNPLLVTASLLMVLTAKSALAEEYTHGPDSEWNDEVPHGSVTQHVWSQSTAYPDTKRRYSVYVPDQYDAALPAALMVFQDGHAFESTMAIFDCQSF